MRRVVVTGMGAVTPIGIGVVRSGKMLRKRHWDLVRLPGLIRRIIKYILLRK